MHTSINGGLAPLQRQGQTDIGVSLGLFFGRRLSPALLQTSTKDEYDWSFSGRFWNSSEILASIDLARVLSTAREDHFSSFLDELLTDRRLNLVVMVTILWSLPMGFEDEWAWQSVTLLRQRYSRGWSQLGKGASQGPVGPEFSPGLLKTGICYDKVVFVSKFSKEVAI